MSPQLLDEANIDSGPVSLPLPRSTVDSTRDGELPAPTAPLPGISHPVEIREPGSPQDTGRPWFSISLHRERRSGAPRHPSPPYPVPTPSPARGRERQRSLRAHRCSTAARPHQPGAYARQLPRQSLCRKQRRGKRRGRGPGWSSLGALDRLKPVQTPGGAVAESPIPLPAQLRARATSLTPVLDLMEMGRAFLLPARTNLPRPHSARTVSLSFHPSGTVSFCEREPVCCLSCTP